MSAEDEGINAVRSITNKLRSAYLEDMKLHYQKNGIDMTDADAMEMYEKGLDTLVYLAQRKKEQTAERHNDKKPE